MEWPLRNPCWCSLSLTDSDMVGKRMDSRIFIDGESREIGLKLVPLSAGLPGFSNGIILAFFQLAGMCALFTELL